MRIWRTVAASKKSTWKTTHWPTRVTTAYRVLSRSGFWYQTRKWKTGKICQYDILSPEKKEREQSSSLYLCFLHIYKFRHFHIWTDKIKWSFPSNVKVVIVFPVCCCITLLGISTFWNCKEQYKGCKYHFHINWKLWLSLHFIISSWSVQITCTEPKLPSVSSSSAPNSSKLQQIVLQAAFCLPT